MSWLSKFLHPEKGYQEGQQVLQNYHQQAQSNLQPYQDIGMEQYSNLKDLIQNLMNPSQLNDQWRSNYRESGALKDAEERAKMHGLEVANSMGLGGSNTALNAIQSGVTQLGNEAEQNYLDDMMKKYLSGAQLAQDIFGRGENAATNISNNALNTGANMAQLKVGEKNAPSNLFGNLLGTGIGLLGGALGGPLGGAISKGWNLTGGR